MSILQEPIQNAIARLRKQHNDDGDYEAKSCQRSLSKDVWESISAFANTHGGTLLLGLDEHNGFTCVQDFHLDRVRDQLIEGMGDGGRDGIRLSNPPKYDVSLFVYMKTIQISSHAILPPKELKAVVSNELMIKMFSYHQQNYMKFKIYYIQVVLILKLFLMPLLKTLTLLLSILFL